MKLEATSIGVDLDPQLQRLVERKQRGITPRATSSTARGELAVIARVDDVDAWAAMSQVQAGAVLGKAHPSGHIVTGRIPASQIEAVRSAVISLKPARIVRPALHATIREIGAAEDLLPAGLQSQQGEGAVVGIIDFGCDFAHKNFISKNGKTRLVALWDQTAGAKPDSPFGYGRVYERAEIDAALKTSDPYGTLGHQPDAGSHGTHVMDIAAGNGHGTGTPGVAPEADIIFVQLAATDVAWDGEQVVGSTFGDSVQLVEAAKFIFDRAGNRPCVINLSLGTNGGPHDGSTLVEQALDNLVTASPNRAIVIAASNSHDDGIHASGKVADGAPATLTWEIAQRDRTSNEIEIWYDKADEFVLELIEPAGQVVGKLPLGTNGRARDDAGQTKIFVAHRKGDPNNGDNVIDIFLEAGLPAGRWQLRLVPVHVSNGTFHAWIERDDSGPSAFGSPLDNTHTLGSISCGLHSIVVASYDAHKPSTPLSFFSSEGPTRDGRKKPELSAPGHQVLAANATSVDGAVRMSGTSMAAPAVTGVVALLFAEIAARGKSWTIEDLRNVLMTSAVQQPGAAQWDARYGAGHVNASAALTLLLSR